MKASWDSKKFARGIRALVGGSGTTVVLLSGWPQTAEAYGDVFQLLAERHKVLAVNPPGLGESSPSSAGYDTATISGILEGSLSPEAGETYHLVGHDIGAWIAYAWASQYPAKLKSLSLLDATIPGLVPPRAFPLPFDVNVKLWQFSFNALPDLPEILTQGRERELFDWLFLNKAAHPERITQANRDRYVDCYARPGAMAQGFAYYRAVAQSVVQNVGFGKTRLPMPVLALGGRSGSGDQLLRSMEAFAVRVAGGEIDDCGHYMMEEQPEQVAKRLLEFFEDVESATS